MPLYSYVACYNGGSFADQDSRSNFKGFVSVMLGNMPTQALPGLSVALHHELIDKSARAEWIALPNRKNFWVMHVELSGKLFTLHAVQTQS
jgi:hypothetical protein